MRKSASKALLSCLLAIFTPAMHFSCKNSGDSSTILHQLSTKTFYDQISVDGAVEAVKSVTSFCPNRVEGTIIFLINDGTIVEEGDTLCILENRELSSEYEQRVQDVENTKAEFAKSEANLNLQYALLEAQVKNNEAQTSIKFLDSAQIQYASLMQQKITTLELKKASIEKERYTTKLRLLKTINEFELKKLRLQIARLENRVSNIKNTLGEMTILATQKGLALRSKSPYNNLKLNEGDVVWQGIAIVVMPDLSQMKVVMKVAESDFKRITVGDSVGYTFDSAPLNYAFGKIISKASVGNPVSRDSKVKFFDITASVDSFLVIPEPGISAKCTITLKSVPDTIVVPQLAIFEEDSLKIVYVSTQRQFERREILLGESTQKEAVVVAGLVGDEIISFVKPHSKKISEIICLPDSIKKRFIVPSVSKPPVEGLSTHTGRNKRAN